MACADGYWLKRLKCTRKDGVSMIALTGQEAVAKNKVVLHFGV